MDDSDSFFISETGEASRDGNSSLAKRLHESIARLKSTADSAADADALARRVARRTELLRRRVEVIETDVLQFLGLNCGRQRYGIPLGDVLEVQALDHFTAVPNTPPFLRGVTHWRGAVLALLDLSRLLGISESGLVDTHVCVVVEAGRRRIGVIAAEVDDLYTVPRRLLPSPPSFPGEVPTEWIYGVYEHQRLVLNTTAVLDDPRLRDWRTER
jgi:purine-binding chemotaxis protein CheW